MRLLIFALILVAAGPVWACPAPSTTLLFHSCWGQGRAALALLPEDGLPAATGRLSLTVTGGYTGRDSRGPAGHPNPVGLFLRAGQVVNRTLVRMDGVALIAPDGGLSLHHRARVALGPDRFDLTDPGQRDRFVADAAARGYGVLQSHLLIIDGRIDVTTPRDAPQFQRRLLFTDAAGFGLYQTRGIATLEAAARALAADHAPVMAMNLDMGSYDYCTRSEPQGTRPCGFLAPGDTAKLSNLLTLRLDGV